MNGNESISAYCCECQKETSCEIVGGDTIYPHRPDLHVKKFIQCPLCKNYTGITAGENPTIPTEHIRRCRYEAHRALDEIWKNKKLKKQYYQYMSKKYGTAFHWGMVRDKVVANRALADTKEFISQLGEKKGEKNEMSKYKFDIEHVTEWKAPDKIDGLDPRILCMPNVVKPLHRQAPRTLLGQSTWDRMRRRCYFEADYKCEVCGATVGKDIAKKDLHGHELYSTDYVNGISKFERCVSLCAMCHIRCIHTGRAYTMYKKGSPFMTGNMVLEGAKHAFSLVHKWNIKHPDEEPLRLYATWVQFAKDKNIGEDICSLIDKYDIKFYGPTKNQARWEDWKLIIGEREYPTPYKNEQEWDQTMEELDEKNPNDERNYKDPFTGGVYDEIKKVLKNS